MESTDRTNYFYRSMIVCKSQYIQDIYEPIWRRGAQFTHLH